MTAVASPAAHKVAGVLIETEIAHLGAGADRLGYLRKRRAGLVGQSRKLVDQILALGPGKGDEMIEIFLRELEDE